MATIKAGTYRFNDVLTAPSDVVYAQVNITLPTIEVDGETDNLNCSKIECFDRESDGALVVLYDAFIFYIGINYEPYGFVGWNAFSIEYGVGSYYGQTITIPTDQEVSDEFYAWFTANAAEVVEDTEETPVATIIYGGSVIASLNEGQTATLKCAGMKMESDVVVEVAEQTESTPPNIQPLTITENGTYTAEDGVDGYSPITVEVESGGEGEPLDLCIEGGRAEVNLPNATKIKKYAFKADSTLVNITMPKVTSIGADAFYYCSNLVLTSLPSGLTSMGDNAFRYCSKLALTSLPNGLTSIPSNAFNDDRKLAITEIPSSVTSIGDSAFSYCYGLTSLTFKGTPTSISSCFYQCVNLKTINVPWAEGEVSGAPWGATNAQIVYSYKGE